MNKILGVDIGGVIIDRINDDKDTSFFSDNYLKTTPVPDVLESLRLLNSRVGGDPFDHIVLISKCGVRTQQRTHEWLDARNLEAFTGITMNDRLFCRKRHEKVPIAEHWGVTHFVDDRLEILKYMVGIVPNLYLFHPNPDEVLKFHATLAHVKIFWNWKDLTIELRK